MISRPPYRPDTSLITEAVHVGLPLETKEALKRAARHAGKSVSGFAREAVVDAIERGRIPRPINNR